MPDWTADYQAKLQERFTGLLDGIDTPIEDVTVGRVAPALEDIAIGSARKLRGAALFFDIRGFTNLNASSETADLQRVLTMLDCVIPTVMQIVYDHDGYVEKNTGDGVMALIGLGEDDVSSANLAIDVAVTTFFALRHIVNPELEARGIAAVNARIGLDLGEMLIARIGTPTGSSDHPRNFLTAVGPTPNIACKLQSKAGTNEIWVGDLAKSNARENRQQFFVRKDATDSDWIWIYKGTTNRYPYWNYNAVRKPH